MFWHTIVVRMFHQLHAASLYLSKLLMFFVQAVFRCGGLALSLFVGNAKAYLAGVRKCEDPQEAVV
jgi:hypothetical protein